MARPHPLRFLREAWEKLLDLLSFPFLRSQRDCVPYGEWRDILQAHELESWGGEGTRHNNFLNLAESIRLLGLDEPAVAGKLVLDVGAGPRSAAYYLPGKRTWWLALDPLGPEYFRQGLVEKQNNASYVSGIAEKLPFKDASLDAIVCVNSMDHMIHPAASAEEFRRTLKPGGRVYLSVELFNHFRSRKRWYKDCHPYDFSREFIDGLFQGFAVEREQVHREGDRQQLNAVYAKLL